VHEEGGVGATINHKNHLNTCADDSHARGLNSKCTELSKQAAVDMGIIVDSQSAAQSYPSGDKNELQKVASNSFLEH
jgi:hypothetical protein